MLKTRKFASHDNTHLIRKKNLSLVIFLLAAEVKNYHVKKNILKVCSIEFFISKYHNVRCIHNNWSEYKEFLNNKAQYPNSLQFISFLSTFYENGNDWDCLLDLK